MSTLLLASKKVLPSVLLPAYDWAVAARDRSTPLIGGFQTALERECFAILFRGTVPVTIVPARQFDAVTDHLRLGVPWADVRAAIATGRVSIVEPPGMVGTRQGRENARRRNDRLLTLADEVALLFASPGGETERVVRAALDRGMPVRVLDVAVNARWRALGAGVLA